MSGFSGNCWGEARVPSSLAFHAFVFCVLKVRFCGFEGPLNSCWGGGRGSRSVLETPSILNAFPSLGGGGIYHLARDTYGQHTPFTWGCQWSWIENLGHTKSYVGSSFLVAFFGKPTGSPPLSKVPSKNMRKDPLAPWLWREGDAKGGGKGANQLRSMLTLSSVKAVYCFLGGTSNR